VYTVDVVSGGISVVEIVYWGDELPEDKIAMDLITDTLELEPEMRS
jgi:hypothetical protein